MGYDYLTRLDENEQAEDRERMILMEQRCDDLVETIEELLAVIRDWSNRYNVTYMPRAYTKAWELLNGKSNRKAL